jgi:hypothetical protein
MINVEKNTWIERTFGQVGENLLLECHIDNDFVKIYSINPLSRRLTSVVFKCNISNTDIVSYFNMFD